MEPVSDAADEDEDRWHVLIAPDEVKVLSLEQLDDLFRLDIIDENVRVWKDGMQDWLPLSVVAGMDSEPEPRPAPVAVKAPAKPVPVDPWASPIVSPFGATLPATGYATPLTYNAPESIRPIVVSDPPMPHTSSSSGARWLVGLALVAGLAVTLYRNDVIRDLARSAGQSATYARLEQAVGAPGFGTLSAVEQMAGASISDAATASLGVVAPAAKPEPARAAPPPVPVTPEPAPAAAPAKPSAPEPATVSLESLVKESVGASKDKAAKASHPVGHAPHPHAAPSRPSSPDIGIKGSRHAYDPLNSKL